MRAYWKVRGDEIIDPSGRTVAVVIPDLPFLVRKDLIERIEEPYNSRYARRRPKFVSDAEWVAALHQARLLGYANGPQPPRRVTR